LGGALPLGEGEEDGEEDVGVKVLCGGGEVALLWGAEPESEAPETAEPEIDAPEVEDAGVLIPLPLPEAEADPDPEGPGANTGREDAPAGSALARVRSGFWPGRVRMGRGKPSVLQEVITTSTYSCASVKSVAFVALPTHRKQSK